jgi:hypothetical protein
MHDDFLETFSYEHKLQVSEKRVEKYQLEASVMQNVIKQQDWPEQERYDQRA